MKQIFYLKSFRVLAVFLAISFAFLSFYHVRYREHNSEIQIKKFDKARDTQFILDCFKNDRYWLTNNPEFSEQFMIDHMTPKQEDDPAFFGKQNIVVMFVKDVPVGFGAYHMKSFYQGFIHFLCIDRQFRGKGYAPILMKYMMAQLQKMGAKFFKLYTRINNLPARALYSKLGFKESESDSQGFVTFEMYL
jgi:ribosomal protein S18 acetylase RimI-like enzyme